MPTEKVSLTLDQEVLAEARRVVGAGELSGYVNQAVERQLQRDRLRGLLDELAREHGPVDAATMEEVRREWPDPE